MSVPSENKPEREMKHRLFTHFRLKVLSPGKVAVSGCLCLVSQKRAGLVILRQGSETRCVTVLSKASHFLSSGERRTRIKCPSRSLHVIEFKELLPAKLMGSKKKSGENPYFLFK